MSHAVSIRAKQPRAVFLSFERASNRARLSTRSTAGAIRFEPIRDEPPPLCQFGKLLASREMVVVNVNQLSCIE